jgi:hypothetical protein
VLSFFLRCFAELGQRPKVGRIRVKNRHETASCPVAHSVVSIVMIAVAAVLFLALVGVSIRLGLDERKL